MRDEVQLRPELKGTPKPPYKGYGADTSQVRREWELANGRCPEVTVGSERWAHVKLCCRSIKTEGALKCNMHLGVDRRREAKEAEREAKTNHSMNNQARAARLVEQLAVYGIEARPSYSSITNTYTGGLTISGPEADKLLKLLNGDLADQL